MLPLSQPVEFPEFRGVEIAENLFTAFSHPKNSIVCKSANRRPQAYQFTSEGSKESRLVAFVFLKKSTFVE